jgi:hypothetical protein
MIGERIRAWLENPIFVKHLRSRLRKQSLVAAIVVVQALCLCIVWGGYQFGSFESGGAFRWLYILQIIILLVLGGAQAGSAVGGARASGILDFHRVSPLSPAELVLGFVFGAPIREYILFATTLPYAVLCLAFGEPILHEFVQWMILLIVTAWVFHGLALLNGLISKPKTSSRGVIGVVVFLLFVFSNFILSMGRLGLGVDLGARISFYGWDLPWLAVVVMHESAVLFFIYQACVRRMASERIHVLSKPQATAAIGALSFFVMGDAWHREAAPPFMLAILYVSVIAAILLILMVTPNQAEFMKGLWRARKLGRRHLSVWHDLSLNRVFLAIACAAVLATATFAWGVVIEVSSTYFGSTDLKGYPMAIATSVLVVAYFGLAMQYFNLRFGARAKMYFGLFLFLAWILPLVGGTIVLMASAYARQGTAGQIIFSLSPIAGVGTSAVGIEEPSLLKAVQGAAIAPALCFTFVFNSLLIGAHRRALKGFAAISAKPAADDVTDVGRPEVLVPA